MASQKPLSRHWLLLGTAALAIAGLFSLVLVVARTPQLNKLPYFSDLFHKALVVHVDLSVLVWFLCIFCMFVSAASSRRQLMPYLEESALVSVWLGVAAITLSPFDRSGEALMSNYIPVIHSPAFFVGLALVACGVVLMLIRMCGGVAVGGAAPVANWTILATGILLWLALCAFYVSYTRIPSVIDGQQYYELLFWGGGHLLQFAWVSIMMICWIAMLEALKPGHAIFKTSNYLPVLPPVIAVCYLMVAGFVPGDITGPEYISSYTHLMIWGNGLPPMLLVLLLAGAAWKARNRKNALWTSLAASIALFLYGGALGGMITGQNVVIPAHYHGSIVGVTLAFMGAAYLYLPKFGYRDVSGWKLAYWQPIVYAVGQVMHISGLAWSGGYGVLRKTPGQTADLALSVKAALGFMGLGGLIAIIGGLMFVIVIYKSVKRA
jgi:cytochrome c oxidase subunit I